MTIETGWENDDFILDQFTAIVSKIVGNRKKSIVFKIRNKPNIGTELFSRLIIYKIKKRIANFLVYCPDNTRQYWMETL